MKLISRISTRNHTPWKVLQELQCRISQHPNNNNNQPQLLQYQQPQSKSHQPTPQQQQQPTTTTSTIYKTKSKIYALSALIILVSRESSSVFFELVFGSVEIHFIVYPHITCDIYWNNSYNHCCNAQSSLLNNLS